MLTEDKTREAVETARLQERIAPPQFVTFEAIMPAAMAVRAEESGVKRAGMDVLTLFVLSLLGGAFVAFGAIFSTTVSAGTFGVSSPAGALSATLPYGIVRLLAGTTFTVGLMLVIISGAELFTGNSLIVIAWASRKVPTVAVVKNWVISFIGNVAGALATAVLAFYSTQYTFGGGSVGLAALNIANGKAALAFPAAFILAIFCNTLVCLAVWMCFSARTNIDRAVAAIPPIAAFAAAGFEHCIANAYFFPLALFVKAGAPESFWKAIGKTPADFPELTWLNFVGNMIPVTLGNAVGGSLLVGAVYWFTYLRKPL